MTKEITVQKEPQESLLEIISRVATDTSIPVDRMIAIFELQERLMNKEAEIALNLAFAKAEPRIEPLLKSKPGAKTKEGAIKYFYTPYDKVDKMLRPVLRDCGLSLSFSTRPIDGKAWSVVIATEITKGASREAMIPYAPDSNSQLNTPQQIISGTSYAQKQLVKLLFNLIFEEEIDDDGGFAGAINAEQIGKIERMLIATGTSKEKFAKYLTEQFEISEVALIPAKGYDTVMKILQQKKEQVK